MVSIGWAHKTQGFRRISSLCINMPFRTYPTFLGVGSAPSYPILCPPWWWDTLRRSTRGTQRLRRSLNLIYTWSQRQYIDVFPLVVLPITFVGFVGRLSGRGANSSIANARAGGMRGHCYRENSSVVNALSQEVRLLVAPPNSKPVVYK